MIVREVTEPAEKEKIVRSVLEALTDWFEVTETREAYIRESGDRLLYAAYDGDLPVGFICLKETGKDTAELSVLGVLKEYHRKGIGRELFLKAKEAGANLVLYGHSHRQAVDEQEGIILLNPGALKAGDYAVVTLDRGKIGWQLKNLNDE